MNAEDKRGETCRPSPIPISRGAYVGRVQPGSFAARAGIVPGDIIIEIDGRLVHRMEDALDVMDQVFIGQEIKVLLRRDYARVRCEVKIQ